MPGDHQQTQADWQEKAAYSRSGQRDVQTVVVKRIPVETGDKQVSIDAMKQALEALERVETKLRYGAITALRAAIEQAQEPRQWQGLTDEELNQIYAEPQTHAGQYARAIEARLKEKNT